MDEPDLAWPAWKFGMKREDLFTKLHDQYNTFPSSIQDQEAFHHDVFEVSHQATTADEFHQLMADRKTQRLRELNNSLESASVEIIANPSLIGTAQWQYALQLFRTRSLDSLVRYFASYLPDDHAWHRAEQSASDVDSCDSYDSVANSMQSSFFDDKPAMIDEPFSLPSQLPPSPRSMTTCSDSIASSGELSHHAYELNTLTPARTLSFSESEPEHFGLKDSYPHLHEDDTSQSSGPETPVSSVSDPSETHREDLIAVAAEIHEVLVAEPDEYVSSQLLPDTTESETPTPKPETAASPFFAMKPSPLAHATTETRRSPRSPRLRRRECSPTGRSSRRRSPGEPSSRIHKPIPDPIRSRPRGRRWAEC